jgi:transcriptional regulator with XRE-family HTH domain
LSILYSNIENLCKDKNITVTQLCRETMIPRAVLSELKSGRSKTISVEYINTIANYFEVSVDKLLGNEKPVIRNGDGLFCYHAETICNCYA